MGSPLSQLAFSKPPKINARKSLLIRTMISGLLVGYAALSCNGDSFESVDTRIKEHHPAPLPMSSLDDDVQAASSDLTDELLQESATAPHTQGHEAQNTDPTITTPSTAKSSSAKALILPPIKSLPAPEHLSDEEHHRGTVHIQVAIHNIRWDDGGDLCFAVYDNSRDFLTDNTLHQGCTSSTQHRTQVELTVPDHVQSIAVSVLHDSDQNGELNRGLFGIPTEGIGFSNNPSLFKARAPRYHEAMVPLFQVSDHQVIDIRMIYLW